LSNSTITQAVIAKGPIKDHIDQSKDNNHTASSHGPDSKKQDRRLKTEKDNIDHKHTNNSTVGHVKDTVNDHIEHIIFEEYPVIIFKYTISIIILFSCLVSCII